MRVTRHYLTIAGRRVHYRRCGNGPPLLLVHQSPRSSAEYESLLQRWGAHFTCIAPDTPGFGQSDPLPPDRTDIADFADATAGFIRALGLPRVAAYGFHSGGIILVTALRRHPDLFHGCAIGGYAVWTAHEMASFGEHYLPPFPPTPYGEHLTWLWNRILEQSWFFPWYDVSDHARLSVAHDDPARVHAIAIDMLDAGDAYRAGYGAVLRAPRDIPPPDAAMPPVLISAYDGDPLQAHLGRLGALPAGWRVQAVATPAEHQEISLDFLLALPGQPCGALAADGDAGFADVRTEGFAGDIHWARRGDSDRLHLHRPGEALDLLDGVDGVVCDVPGHGLSSGWVDSAPTDWSAWQAVFDGFCEAHGLEHCTQRPRAPADPERHFPDLSPDRFGSHLTRGWAIVRAAALFDPWYEAQAANARTIDPHTITPEQLAIAHRALLRARAAKPFAIAINQPQH